jgi:hypothetical protein
VSDNVVSLSSGPIQRDRKAEFLAQIGGAYDDYVAQSGEEPEAIVYVLGGAHQATSRGWTMRDRSQGAAAAVIARAGCALSFEVMQPDD